jgi:hypothetical protein
VTDEVFDAETSGPEFGSPELIRFHDSQGRAITAAVQILNGPKIKRPNKPKQNGKGLPWQTASWEYVDEIGEYSLAVEMLSTAVSKVQLVAGRDVLGVDEPIIINGEEYTLEGDTVQASQLDKDAAALVNGFAGGTTGQQQVMYRAAFQLIVAAESFIVGRQDAEGNSRWDAYSNEEMSYSQKGWTINDGTENYTLTPEDILIRVWRPSPRRRSEPRSSSKPLLPVLAEIKGLTQSIAARIDSRLAGAGVLFVPESMSLMSASDTSKLAEGEDPFVAELTDAMLTPIGDRDSAAAVVPIVVRVPDDSIGKVQHIRFEVTAKAEEAAQRQDAILRMARSMDLPPEQILGMGSMNHWGAWQVDEATLKGPVDTLVMIIVHALTVGYVRPGLIALGHDPADVEEYLAWRDLTQLIQRPDRSEQALKVFELGGIGYDALNRESGFDDADKPTEEDTCRQLMLTLVKSDPANAVHYIQTFGPCAGIELPNLVDLPVAGAAVVPAVDTQQIPELPQNNREIPQLAAAIAPTHRCLSSVDGLYPLCEMAVLRALELAGKRMRGSSPRNERSGLLEIPAHELHTNAVVAAQMSRHGIDTLLEGAWAPLRQIMLGHEPDGLVPALDEYVRLLIERREPHTPDWLRPIIARYAA